MHNADIALPRSTAWPRYRYDAANTGYNPEARGPTDEVETAWRYSRCTEGDLGVVVHDGQAYLGNLVLDGQTGRRQNAWNDVRDTPTIADGTLYARTTDGLEARDATTGEHLWTFEGVFNPPGDVVAGLPTPTVAAGTVYVLGGSESEGWILYAIDAETGAERWHIETDGEFFAPAAALGETVYIIDDTNTVRAIDGPTGEERWQTTPSVEVWRAAPAVADGRLYFRSLVDDGASMVLALGTADGATVWRQRVAGELTSPVAVAEGTVFVAGRQGLICGLTATNGHHEWAGSFNDAVSGELGVPAVADGVVYVGVRYATESAPLFALDGTTGEQLWRVDTRAVSFGDYTEGGIYEGPAVVDGAVFASTRAGDFYAIHGR